MRVLLPLILVLFMSSNVFGARFLLLMKTTWCHNCPAAKTAIMQPEPNRLMTEYDHAYEVDIDKWPQIARRFNITSIPRFVVVDVKVSLLDETTEELGTLYMTGDAKNDVNRLSSFLRKFLPEKPLTKKRLAVQYKPGSRVIKVLRKIKEGVF